MPKSQQSKRRTVTEADEQAILTYRPRNMRPHEWERIRPFVTDTMLDYLPHTAAQDKNLVHLVATLRAYVHWATKFAGRDLTREALLDPELIAYYAAEQLPTRSNASKSNARSALLRITDFLMPERRRLRKLAPLPHKAAEAPFSEADANLLLVWPLTHTTPYARHAAACMIHFGLGCGLRAGELAALRREDVTEDADGVLVTVTGGTHPRVIPVRADHEDACMALAGCASPGGFVFRPDRTVANAAAVSSWVSRLTTFRGQNMSMIRLRSTWIVHHLNANTSAKALTYAAGMAGFTGFDRYLSYVRPDRVDDIHAQLRRADREKDSQRSAENAEYRRERARQLFARRRARHEFLRDMR